MTRRSIAAFALACLIAAAAPLLHRPSTAPVITGFPGWPASFEGKPLVQLPLSPIEERFQRDFPGKVGRFSDGRREIILRWVAGGSRKLHPAGDCFKANAYAITMQPIYVRNGERWSGFLASKDGRTLLVRERITGIDGKQWSDVSAWYWAVQLGQTHGPWWAVTVAETAS